MRNDRIQRIVLAGSVLALGILCMRAKGNLIEAESSAMQEEEKEPGAWIETDREGVSVKAWYNEEDARYYFFLPDYLRKENQKEQTTIQKEAEQITLSNIPSVFISLETGTLSAVKESKENKEKMKFFLFTGDAGSSEEGLKGTVKARGNASFNAPKYKKSYTVRLEEEQELSGMSAGKDWVLLAHYYDDTHLRDYLTFDMARVLDMAYVPEGQFVNLYMEGEFQGIYFLCQKIEISPEKIAVANLEQQTLEKMPKEALARYPYAREGTRGGQNVIIEKGYAASDDSFDITGGYLLELEWLKDRYNEEKSGFTSNANQCVVIKSPEYATRSQVVYIKNRYQELEDAIRRSLEEDSDEYLAYMDLDSFVKKYLIEEVSKNMDANLSSQYLYKDSDNIDSKFYAGPVWDYDRAYDNKVGDENNRGAAMFWVNQGSAGFDFWKKLYGAGAFQKRVREIYSEKLSPVLNEYAENKLWEWEAEIHDSVIADMFRYQSEYEESMEEEVRLSAEMQALSEFIKERKAFLDSQWIKN